MTPFVILVPADLAGVADAFLAAVKAKTCPLARGVALEGHYGTSGQMPDAQVPTWRALMKHPEDAARYVGRVSPVTVEQAGRFITEARLVFKGNFDALCKGMGLESKDA